MCIAIYKPASKIISKETLEQCYNSNPDGAGFMYAEDKKLYTQKGFFTFKNFYKAYKQHETKQAAIHFRIKTHGQINKENCHPFLINDSLGFIHNGIISGYGDSDKSDTIRFNEKVFQPLVSKWGNLALFQDPMIQLIETTIGYSKLVFLDRHGNHTIMNEAKGTWDDGIWYSNTSYKQPKPTMVGHYEPNNWLTRHKNYYPKPIELSSTISDAGRVIAVGDLVELTADYEIEGSERLLPKNEWYEVLELDPIAMTCTLQSDSGPTVIGSGIAIADVENYDYTSNVPKYDWESGKIL
tara:strand:- start:468 stop:1358 length:891 start_codon:yes stop_codon:yes gene_type:complete